MSLIGIDLVQEQTMVLSIQTGCKAGQIQRQKRQIQKLEQIQI